VGQRNEVLGSGFHETYKSAVKSMKEFVRLPLERVNPAGSLLSE